MVEYSGDNHLLTNGLEASPSRTGPHLPRSLASSQWQSCDAYPSRKNLKFLYAHLLPTALSDDNWNIKNAREPTCIHFCVFPWSVSLRSRMSLLRKLGGGFIKGLIKPDNSASEQSPMNFLLSWCANYLPAGCILLSRFCGLPGLGNLNFKFPWWFNSPLTIFLAILPPCPCTIPYPNVLQECELE